MSGEVREKRGRAALCRACNDEIRPFPHGRSRASRFVLLNHQSAAFVPPPILSRAARTETIV
jgi:hypothetical protein